MSFNSSNETIRTAIEILESSDAEVQKRMLYLLKLEKARIIARELDTAKPKVKRTDKEITEIVHRIRKGYGKK